MKRQTLFPVQAFAKLSRTTRATLHYYDKIGLLEPVARGSNKYRQYSVGQLGFVNTIRILQDLGMPLAAIRELAARRTPESVCTLLTEQLAKVDAEMTRWADARLLLQTYRQAICAVANIDEKAITLQSLPETAIILGGPNDYSAARSDYDALLSFYQDMEMRFPNLNLNYPVWGFFSEEMVRRRDWGWPERYYFFNPEGRDRRPAALYAIAYVRGEYSQHADAFVRLMDFIDARDLEVCGPAYTEYPLNEVCITDHAGYLLRVMVTVRERGSGAESA